MIELVDKDMLKRARILGAAFRAAHMVSAAMPGVLTNTPIAYEGNRLVWTLPDPYSNLEGERVERRFARVDRHSTYHIDMYLAVDPRTPRRP